MLAMRAPPAFAQPIALGTNRRHDISRQRFFRRGHRGRRLRSLDGEGDLQGGREWDGHGAFTKALIEAIGEGKAASDPSKPITTELLAYYVAERVKELTGGPSIPS